MSASAPARLVTIPISHYCEKARWALDRAGIAYREERHVQIVHRVASRRAGGGGTVPVLVAPEGVFAQSADILAYAGRHGAELYPDALRDEVTALERDFDADLGPEGRRWMYFHLLPRKDIGVAYNCTGVPAWERRAFPVMLGVMSGYIRHLFAIGPDAWRTGAATSAATPSPPPTSPSPRWPRPRSSRPSTAPHCPSPTSCRRRWPRASAPSAPTRPEPSRAGSSVRSASCLRRP